MMPLRVRVLGPRRLGMGGYWVVADGAQAWDPDGLVTGRLLENRQWERTLFAALQVYRVKMTSASDLVPSAVE